MNTPRPWRWLEARRWRRAMAADEQALAQALDAARQAPGDLATLRPRLRRAAARGDADGLARARIESLAAVIAAVEQASQEAVVPDVVRAALALRLDGAVALARVADRQQAIALATASVALAGARVHVVCGSDEDAAALAGALARPLAICGLRVVALSLDMSPADLAQAYRAPVVCASVRRLAADLARDDTLVQRLGADGPAPRLVPEVQQAFVEPLDRVLADDALGPIQLSIADDPTRLADALAAARQLVDALNPGVDHADGQLLDAGRQVLGSHLATWPPAWRGQARAEMLVRQALYVRDGLVAGRDYHAPRADTHSPLWLDDTLAERLPEREFAATLQQALQLRLGLPMSPVGRTIGRSSVPSFFARYAALAGTAPCLQGLDSELWHQYGLLRAGPDPAAPAACHVKGLRDGEAVSQALAELVNADDATLARLIVLKRASDAAPLQRSITCREAAWALEGTGPRPALQALLAAHQDRTMRHATEAAEPASSLTRLRVIFAEPMDQRRAETAWLLRAADAVPTDPGHNAGHEEQAAVEAYCLVAADSRWLAQRLPLPAALARRVCRVWPGLASGLLPPLVAWAQARTAQQTRAHRQALPERERQLQRQLSFTAAAPVRPSDRSS